jgi:hypothetical protein
MRICGIIRGRWSAMGIDCICSTCYKCSMAVMSIRNVSPVLMRELKAEAARRGVTLREHVIAVLTPGHLDKIFGVFPGQVEQAKEIMGIPKSSPPKIDPEVREPLWKDKSKKKLV